ncbi:MAG: ATP-binding protein [Chitinophagaceae bacterium]|nr:ATP-binding protein [Chitinophagaceae bacterium]
MEMLQRALYNSILANTGKQKVSILLGARRVGKTHLLQEIRNNIQQGCLWMNGEDQTVADMLDERSIANYKRLLQGYTLLIIDEAQYISDMNRKLKLMIDEITPLHIIITGSSAFDMQQSGEPLTGRSITYTMFPVAQMELAKQENLIQTKELLDERLIFGSYPEVITLPALAEKQQYLFELINTYLLKDILAFESIRNPQKLKDLLVLLAYQIGSEVSLDELGRQLGLSKNTVERYLDLLSKVFVIYNRRGYSKNLRKEVAKSSRWYFYDNGIRNALISNFNLPALRQDMGMLWENYMAAERIKYNTYNHLFVNSYFWRTYDQQEIDLVEEQNTVLSAYEFKWKQDKTKIPVAFAKAYPGVPFSVIHSKNYLDFIT